MKLTAFLDESYDPHYYWICSVISEASDSVRLSNDLDSIASGIAAACDMEKVPEMHAHEVFQGKGVWKLDPHLKKYRGDFLTQFCNLIASSNLTLILQGIDRDKHTHRYSDPLPPHEVLMMYSLERINEHARKQDSSVHVIADHIHMQGALQKNLNSYRNHSTWGYKAQRLDRVTSLEFAKSHDYRLIQIADLVAYLARREYISRQQSSPERLTAYLWKIVLPNIKVWRIWP